MKVTVLFCALFTLAFATINLKGMDYDKATLNCLSEFKKCMKPAQSCTNEVCMYNWRICNWIPMMGPTSIECNKCYKACSRISECQEYADYCKHDITPLESPSLDVCSPACIEFSKSCEFAMAAGSANIDCNKCAVACTGSGLIVPECKERQLRCKEGMIAAAFKPTNSNNADCTYYSRLCNIIIRNHATGEDCNRCVLACEIVGHSQDSRKCAEGVPLAGKQEL